MWHMIPRVRRWDSVWEFFTGRFGGQWVGECVEVGLHLIEYKAILI